MKKIFLCLSFVALLSVGCSSAQQGSVPSASAPIAKQTAVTTQATTTAVAMSPKPTPVAVHPGSSPTPTKASQAILNIEAGIFTKPSDAEIKAMLTPLEYQVTQQAGTETPFDNPYWNNEQPGIYLDIVSGEPLFSSTDKYDSGTGWPSFTKPISPNAVITRPDNSLGMQGTEVISAIAHSHLGHLFPDGPPPLGTRYCMNSASLRFIPKADLQAQGYGKYSYLFQ